MLLVSSELDEVVALADRIAVMYRGKILAIVPPTRPREQLGLLMAGVTDERRRTGASDSGLEHRATLTAPTTPKAATDGRLQLDRSDRARAGSAAAGRGTGRPPNRPPAELRSAGSSTFITTANPFMVSLLSIVTALVIGAILIVLAQPRRW